MKIHSSISLITAIISFSLFASTSQADSNAFGKVTQVFRDTQRVVSTFTGGQPLAVNSVVVVTSSSGEACEGTLLELSGTKALIDLASCTSFQEIKAGSTVSKAEFQTQAASATVAAAPAFPSPPAPEPSGKPAHDSNAELVQTQFDESNMVPNPSMERATGDSSRNLRFSVGTFLSLGKTLRFDSASGTSGSDQSKAEVYYDMEHAVGFLAEIAYSRRYSWGFNLGGSLETKRRLKSLRIDENGISTTLESTEPSFITFNQVYANALYRWNNWYLPFGFNISLPSEDKAPIFFKHMTNQAGYQVGVGFVAQEQFAFEAIARATQIHLGGVSIDSSTYLEFGYGWLYTVNLAAKLLF